MPTGWNMFHVGVLSSVSMSIRSAMQIQIGNKSNQQGGIYDLQYG